jgi:DNA-binding MarR family transcriptional regulator
LRQELPELALTIYFRLLNEIGIIAQLSRSLLEARLPSGFVLTQFSVLNHLVRVRDGQTPLELARAFQMPKTSMTHSLAVLERAGLIALHANPVDGRSKLVHITDAGRAFRQSTIDALAPDLGRIAAAIPPDQVAKMLPDLESLRQFLDAERAPLDKS